MKIVSGGQTGADRAGLDFALNYGLECGGYCPRGRKAEDGPISGRYPLEELESEDYRKRTQKNAVDSQATVIFSYGKLKRGSLLTHEICLQRDKPCLHLDGDLKSIEDASQTLRNFIEDHFIMVLNVAGQRLSGEPRIYDYTFKVLEQALLQREAS